MNVQNRTIFEDVNWIRNSDDNWYLLDELPRILPSMQCNGIYILWYIDESDAPRTVRVGIKGVNDHLRMMQKDSKVKRYTEHPVYITWAEGKSSSLEYLTGVWSYLYKKLEPLVGPRCPQAEANRVVLPFRPPIPAQIPKQFDYSAEWWQALSLWHRKEKAWRCEECSLLLDEDTRYLHTHHVQGTQHNDLEELKVLCIGCHAEYHPRMKKCHEDYKPFMKRYGEEWKTHVCRSRRGKS